MRRLHVVIGRFEPVHRAHVKLLCRAAMGADNLLVILGSAFQAPSCKNPWSWEERANLIRTCLDGTTSPDCSLDFRPVRDARYDDDGWRQAVVATVGRFAQDRRCDSVTLFGTSKPGDASTWYLLAFPEWPFIAISRDGMPSVDATRVRDNLFKGLSTWERYVLPPVRDYLNQWIHTEEGRRLRGEYLYLKQQRLAASRYPHPLTFTTADAVVHWRDSILLIRRKGELGRGLWALPGGFIDAERETCYQSAKREAQEETGIQLRDEWCLTSRGGEVYDHPSRSLRGRTVTHAYMFRVPDGVEVPLVGGADDAAYACWYPMHDVPDLEVRLFEDHIDIIRDLTSRAGIPQPNWRPELA